MLAAVDVARQQQHAAGRREHEHDADHRLLHVGEHALGPREKQRTAQRRGERGDLHGGAFRLEAQLVGEQHAAAGDLRDGQVDEHDAAREHLRAERHVSGRHQQPGGERRQQDRQVDGVEIHCAPFSRRAIVSSKSPYRSFASASPPTVNGNTTTLIFARSAIHATRGRSGRRRESTIFAWLALAAVRSTSDRCAVVGSTPGLGSSAATSLMPSQSKRYVKALCWTTTGVPVSVAACFSQLRDGGVPALGEGLGARLIERRVVRIEFRQARGQRRRDLARCCADRSGCADCLPDARRRRRDRDASASPASSRRPRPRSSRACPAGSSDCRRCCVTSGSQPISSSAPVATTRSALRARAMRLGLAST